MAVYGTPISTALRAAVKPFPLTVAAGTAAAAFLLTHWLIAPGALIYLVAVYFLGPAKLRRRQREEELGLDLKDAPPGLRRWNATLHYTLQQIEEGLQGADARHARMLKPVAGEVEALGTDIRRLIRQAYTLHRYLNQTNTQFIAARAAHLEAQMANTQDAYSRQQLAEASAALKRQLDNCEQIRVLIGRTEATLENMQASLQSIGSAVVKLTAGEMNDAREARNESLTRLSSARTTVSALEEVLQKVELA